MIDESKDNKTNEISHDLLPDNTVTVIMKVGGKVYSRGAQISEVKPGMPDEDLDSVLRGVRGLALSIPRTLAYVVAKRPLEYEIPTANEEHEEGTDQMIMLADEDIKKGDPVVVDLDLARARKATEEEVQISDKSKQSYNS